MENMTLSQYYDNLKNEIKQDGIKSTFQSDNVVDISKPNGVMQWNNIIKRNSDNIRDNCRKRIILDIYSNILPLDDEYKNRNSSIMIKDVDNMLQNKGIDATEYLRSSYESTKAPLLEFILRSTDNIAKAYIEEADKAFNDAKENNMNPTIPDTEEIENQLIDVKKDSEYENFISELKKKTVDKIVNDISDLINDKKEEDKITFDPSKPAMEKTTVSVCMDYMQKYVKEDTQVDKDLMIALAIRESTLNQIDVVFKQSDIHNIRIFESKIFYNKGYVINESVKELF